jgi:superfamily II DNA or RNA helicase
MLASWAAAARISQGIGSLVDSEACAQTPAAGTVAEEPAGLEEWGVPDLVIEGYKAKGITELKPWQRECLSVDSGAPLQGRSLVFSAPTAGGKTLVAEMLMLKALLAGKRCMYIVPLRALADEKARHLVRVWAGLSVRIKAQIGGKSNRLSLGEVDVVICTIESAATLISRTLFDIPLRRDRALASLGCVVVDEAHILRGGQRGAALELLLTKLLLLQQQRTIHSLQFVAMSATLPGMEQLASWLDASVFRGDKGARDVPLKELLVRKNVVYDNHLRCIGVVNRPSPPPASSSCSAAEASSRSRLVNGLLHGDSDGWLALCFDAAVKQRSTLVFCPTQKRCEDCSKTLVQLLQVMAPPPSEELAASRERLVRLLVDRSSTKQPGLEHAVRYGVAFHHGGLVNDLRSILEDAFVSGTLSIVFATSSLGSGVNLPAQQVLFRTPKLAISLLSAMEYTQMCGRAGRTRGSAREAFSIIVLDTSKSRDGVGREFVDAQFDLLLREGAPVIKDETLSQSQLVEQLTELVERDSRLQCPTTDIVLHCLRLMTHQLPPLQSSLLVGDSDAPGAPVGMRRFVLDLVASGLATTPETIVRCTERSLLHVCDKTSDVWGAVAEAVDWLLSGGLVEVAPSALSDPSSELRLVASRFGQAACASSLAPEEAVMVLEDLEQARTLGLSLHCDGIHGIFFQTPIFRTSEPRWDLFVQWAAEQVAQSRPPLSDGYATAMLAIAARVGITPESIRKHSSNSKRAYETGASLFEVDEDPASLVRHRRWWTALILHAIARGVADPQVDIYGRFGIKAANLERLQEEASTFCTMVQALARELGWTHLRAMLSASNGHLKRPRKQDAVGELLKLPGMTFQKAWSLSQAGYGDIATLGGAKDEEVAELLEQSASYDLLSTVSLWAHKLTEARSLIAAASDRVARLSELVDGGMPAS